ncbi:ubiquitin carboxyl-terminal hydrolase family protein, putative [Ichthyophthirius multifiliis]|uniref:Ubiquitin carboxyl-terminal hydrolase family protein, putative n=1 Tax=Ichthyophthirius multifiliis TaxID=5932 RepID=G0QZS1_ICHMU|nr:ubiquitin carboxyl-terminal hydrolase family protein, putative [Ichthyophthirius multifiliis]EGR29288.1 ubiquitin carboxyl-terminal hydrolase family protein, putative [Ichthyophthirius multifiliis]|eukprot:XP_004030524.1 ubiquitin carboxyl-terminal hydrolase family protein, putative [Ichthyophthirius multifiliis]
MQKLFLWFKIKLLQVILYKKYNIFIFFYQFLLKMNELINNKIIEDIYINNIHSEILSRSGDLIKFLSKENALDKKMISQMFTANEKQDQMTKQIFIKQLSQVVKDASKIQKQYFIQNIKQIDIKDLTKEHIQLIYELNKKIQHSINIMKQIINTYSIKFNTYNQNQEKYYEKMTYKHEIVHVLTKNQGLVQNILNNIQYLKEEYVQKTENQQTSSIQQNNYLSRYCNKIKERIEFIKFLNNCLDTENKFINAGFLQSLWKDIVNKAIDLEEVDIMYKWIRDLAEQQGEIIQEIGNFLQEQLLQKPSLVQQISLEGFKCYKVMFIQLNLQNNMLKVIDDQKKNKFYGSDGSHNYNMSIDKKKNECDDLNDKKYKNGQLNYEEGQQNNFQKINYECNDEQQFKFYTVVQPSFLKGFFIFWSNYPNIKKTIDIINALLNESEKKGIGNLKPLNGLVKGEIQNLLINNEATFNYEGNKKIEIKIESNKTIIDLKILIAKNIQTSWDQIKLIRASHFNLLKESDNSKTIGEIRFKNNETITVEKKVVPTLSEVPLTNEDGSLCDRVKIIFIDWFNQFSVDGKMDKENCAKFIHSCANDNCKADDPRVIQTFNEWDDDKDNLLTLENFLSFYKKACFDKISVVWKNLHSHGYRNDLKKLSEIGEEVEDINILPRKILMQNYSFYNLLFSLLDINEVAEQVKSLLNRLPISPEIMNKVVNLEGVKQVKDRNWNQIFDTQNSYKLLYILTIIEYLMEQQDEENKIINNVVNWCEEFIECGGFEQLFIVFKQYSQHDYQKLPCNQKNIISFILRIMKNYLTSLFTNKIPQLYKINYYATQIKFSLDIIDENLRNLEETDFQNLKEKLNGKLGEMILNTLDLKQILKKLIEILHNILSGISDLESEDRVIIDFSWCIIIDITLFDNQTRKILYESELFESIVMNGLFNQNLTVRRIFSNGLYLISRYDRSKFSENLLRILLENIPNCKDVSKSDCNQYYNLFCKVIQESKFINDFQIDYATLVVNMIQNIKSHVSQETREGNKCDKMLIGFLNMCDKIFSLIQPSQVSKVVDLVEFASYLFNTCLFVKNPQNILEDMSFESIQQMNYVQYNPDFYIKCKQQESRKAAYNVLTTLSKEDIRIYRQIVEKELPQVIDSVKTPAIWNYKHSNEQKSHQNYVGIKNLSQMCYMNSMLQQFYMTSTFRYALLSAQDEQEINLTEYKGIQIDDNVLHQLQRMFSFLDLSDRQDYNPIGFCFSFKDYSGQPVNVGIQQDTQEFLNMIFDKLEHSLKQTPYKSILQSIFGGQTVSSLTCLQCGSTTSRDELFYTLSLTVNGCNNLNESFQKMIEGEIISDYLCDNCQRRCDQARRICLNQLPNILIIHLQRIVFDLDTFANKKINTRLEFPHILNTYKYTREFSDLQKILEAKDQDIPYLEKKDSTLIDEKIENHEDNLQYQYKLKGVTVHSGTAEGGHYYSYVNYKDDKWIEMNDSKIKEFDALNIESECFGGLSQKQGDNWWEKEETQKSAYILIYEKTLKNTIKIYDKNIDYYSFQKRVIPRSLYEEVWLDNHFYMQDKHIYSIEFFTFFKNIVLQMPKPDDYIPQQNTFYNKFEQISEENQILYQNLLNISLKLIFNVLLKANDNLALKDLIIQIKQIIDLIPQYVFLFCKTFIFENQKQIIEIFTNCQDAFTRQNICQLLVYAINIFVSFSYTSGNNQDQFLVFEGFLDSFLDILNTEVAKNWLKMQHYLEFWRDFVQGGEYQVQWAFQKEFIARFIDFFLGKSSPLTCFGEKKHEIGNKFVQSSFQPLIQLVYYLVCRSSIIPSEEKQYELSQNDKICLENQEFYQRCMIENYDIQCLGYLIVYMCYNNMQMSEMINKLILKNIYKSTNDYLKQYLDLVHYFLNINDQFSKYRIELLFGYPNLKNNYISNNYLSNQHFSIECKTNDLDAQIYFYETKYKDDNCMPLLNQMLHFKRQNESVCLNLINACLQLCKTNPLIFDFVIKSPAPNYSCPLYTSWIRPMVENVLQDTIRYYQNSQKENFLKGILSLCDELENSILINYQNFDSLKPNYFLGKTCQEYLVEEKVLGEQNGQKVILNVFDMEIYYADSFPDGKTNLSFPENIKNFNMLLFSQIDLQNSNIQCIFSYNQNQNNNIDYKKPAINIKQINEDKNQFYNSDDEQQRGDNNRLFKVQKISITKSAEKNNDDKQKDLDSDSSTKAVYKYTQKTNTNYENNNKNINNNDINPAVNNNYINDAAPCNSEVEIEQNNEEVNQAQSQQVENNINQIIYTNQQHQQMEEEQQKEELINNKQNEHNLEEEEENINNYTNKVSEVQNKIINENIQLLTTINLNVNVGIVARKMLIKNMTDKTVQVSMLFKLPQQSQQELTKAQQNFLFKYNQPLPSATVFTIPPNTSETVLCIAKYFPEIPFDQYEGLYEISFVDNISNNNNQVNKNNQISNQNIGCDPIVEYEPQQIPVMGPLNHNQEDFGYQLTDAEAQQIAQQASDEQTNNSQFKSCLTCTYEQPAQNIMCEMCYTSFK